jgi:hypothetical protein
MLSAVGAGQSNLREFSSDAYRPLTRATEDHAMRQMSRLKTATLMTALFVGGAAAGVASRPDSSATTNSQPSAATLPPKVIHKRKVRTVHVKPKSSPATVAPAPAAYVPASVPVASYSPSHVTSRTSGGGGGGGGGEREGGEHEKDD